MSAAHRDSPSSVSQEGNALRSVFKMPVSFYPTKEEHSVAETLAENN